jgi:hypothetical protein
MGFGGVLRFFDNAARDVLPGIKRRPASAPTLAPAPTSVATSTDLAPPAPPDASRNSVMSIQLARLAAKKTRRQAQFAAGAARTGGVKPSSIATASAIVRPRSLIGF